MRKTMNIQYRKATSENFDKIMELIKSAIINMNEAEIYQWDAIYPDEAIIDYMNIKRKKGKILIVNIPIGDYIYTFKWDVNRKK